MFKINVKLKLGESTIKSQRVKKWLINRQQLRYIISSSENAEEFLSVA